MSQVLAEMSGKLARSQDAGVQARLSIATAIEQTKDRLKTLLAAVDSLAELRAKLNAAADRAGQLQVALLVQKYVLTSTEVRMLTACAAGGRAAAVHRRKCGGGRRREQGRRVAGRAGGRAGAAAEGGG